MKLGAAKGRSRSSGVGVITAGAALCALLSGGLVMTYMRSAVDTKTVYVAAQDLAPGTILKTTDLTATVIPSGAVPGGSIANPSEVDGKRIKASLIKGDIMRAGHMVEDGSSDISMELKRLGDDYRALTLPKETLPAMDRVSSGDKIELNAVIPVRTQSETTQVALWVTHGTVMDLIKDSDGKPAGVLLAVKASEVQKIALALKAGNLIASVVPVGVTPQAPADMKLRLDYLMGSMTDTPTAPAAPGTTAVNPGTAPAPVPNPTPAPAPAAAKPVPAKP